MDALNVPYSKGFSIQNHASSHKVGNLRTQLAPKSQIRALLVSPTIEQDDGCRAYSLSDELLPTHPDPLRKGRKLLDDVALSWRWDNT